MKKTFLFILMAFAAILVKAETPMVASAGIRLYYCTPDASSIEYLIGPSETYHWEEYTLTKNDIGRMDIKHTYVNQAGCDSVVTLTLKAVHPFSVSATQTIMFAPGNLQYLANDGTGNLTHEVRPGNGVNTKGKFRFAENQWTVLGATTANLNPSDSQTGWIDVFAYASDGDYNNPYESSNTSNYSVRYKQTISGSRGDWGYNNSIENGSKVDQYGIWRIMTASEWEYLLGESSVFSMRTNAQNLHGIGIVNGVKGLIILPDDWSLPIGLTFTPKVNGGPRNFTTNTYSGADWEKMEANGAVFLPKTCAIHGNNAIDNSSDENQVFYRSGTFETNNSSIMLFTVSWIQGKFADPMSDTYRIPVRLVKNL